MQADLWISLVVGLVGVLAGSLVTSVVAVRQLQRSSDRAVGMLQEAGEVLVRRSDVLVRESQQWYWTDEWQAGEAEADADIAAGRTKVLSSEEDLDEFFASRPAPTQT